MRTLKPVCSRLLLSAAFLLMLLIVHGCIKEDTDVCLDEAQLFITVVDLISGLDITDTGEVSEVNLFIFDPGECYVDHIIVPRNKLTSEEPIPIRHTNIEGLWVSAWGNMKDGQMLPVLDNSCKLSADKISLKMGDDGFAQCPDDLFFGAKQINLDEQTRAVTVIREEIRITRKNARMQLTVLGLPETAEEADYYFTIKGGYSGYNFKGDPMPGEHEIRQMGIFNEKNEYATTAPFNIIHCLEDDNNVSVNLYHVDGPTRAVSLIASINQDDKGVYLAPKAGETTNVLIDLRGASVDVQIQQTPWDEIYNWLTW